MTAEDNELYSISLRGHPTAVSIATLVMFEGLSGTDITDRQSAVVQLWYEERPATVR